MIVPNIWTKVVSPNMINCGTRYYCERTPIDSVVFSPLPVLTGTSWTGSVLEPNQIKPTRVEFGYKSSPSRSLCACMPD